MKDSVTKVRFNTRAARALRGAYEDEKDGALISVTAGAKRLVFFERGYLVGAKSELVEERLGEVIVAEGGVSRKELEEATRFIRSGQKLGRILVELGYLKSGQIETYVRRQIIRIASAMLISKSERLAFSTVIPIEAVTLSPVSIGDVFLDAAFHLTDIDGYREKLLLDDYVLAQTRDALALAGHMKLSEDEAQVLDLVDERNTVSDILAASPLSEDPTLRLLLALHHAGIVALRQKAEFAEAPEAESAPAPEPPLPDPLERELISVFNEMQCQNHWQVLGLGRNASFAEIEQAFQTLSERFDPSKYQHILGGGLQEKLSSVRARLREAFITLSSKTSTTVYDRMVDREVQYEEEKQSWETLPGAKLAEAASARSASAESVDWDRPKNPDEAKALFKLAKRAYQEQDFWRAIELCRSSIELAQDNDPERFHLLGKALAENPRWRQDAEQNLKIAHNLKPWEPRYLVSLAKLYEKVGLQHRAQRLYEQVRVMDPAFPIGDEVQRTRAKTEVGEDEVLDEKAV
jgi:hypothetical protein